MEKMYTKPQYKCGVCGKIYDSILERTQCESACLKKQEEEAKKIEEAKKAAKQNARKEEVENAYKHANELLEKYLEDYGVFGTSSTSLAKIFESMFL